MTRRIHVAGLGAVFLLAAPIALAAATLRMDSRDAPSEAEWPRVHAPDARWLADLSHAASIRLSKPAENERAARDDASPIRRAAAFGRKVTNENSRVTASGGQFALRFSVVSPGALHLRAALAFSDTGQYRVTSYRPGDEAHGVTLYRKSAATVGPPGALWTPVTDGDTQMIVVERMDDAPSQWSVAVSQVSHFDRPLYQPNAEPAFLGASAPCQVDMACVYQVAPTQMQSGVVKANFGVAMMIFTRSDGLTYTCTGTLLNSANYPSPLFLTAHHCLDDEEALSSLTTVWFYNRTACRSGPPNPAAVQVAGGARSVFGSASLDAALVELSQMPPPLATYVGWDATTMQPDTLILAIHHPAGDVKKASFGTEIDIYENPLPVPELDTFPAGTFYLVSWDLGIVEPGSSGSGLLTFDATTGLFYLRGTLTAGAARCTNIGNATTFYARFDTVYPYIESVLTQPILPPAATTAAIEYYYADWNFYFETSFPDEIAALDGGAFGGAWKRTGQTFNVWPQPGGSASPTCRFFSTAFSPRSSHFYTPFAGECATVKTEPEWQYEAIAFYVQLADDSGQCPAGTIPLYRAYNDGLGGAPNHRYTTSLAILNQMIAAGWVFEGNGNTKVFACVPQ